LVAKATNRYSKKVMKYRVLFFAVLVGAFVGSPMVRAQSDGQATTGGQPSAQEQTIRQTLVQKIEQLKYEKIKKDLELDEITAAKFFSVYKPAEKEIQALVKERNFELKALGAATNTSASNAEIAAMTEKIKSLNKQIAAREQRLDGDLTPLLTPLQRAKLLVFEQEFNARVREELAERQGGKGATAAELRKLRRLLREQRIKNQLLKKRAAEKAAGH
jgi:Spy/CpxP family protein refolding chaperone